MSKTIAISDDLKLPVDAATQTFAFIARKGAGKTYAAGKLVEELLDAGVQVVILDTVGNWYGLRLAADGKGKGFDVPVLGGLRGDIPLEATGGALIADIVVDSGRSVIIDVSQFSLADRKRFATALGERLWQRKKGEARPSPLHLVIEESQLIVPQFTGRGGDEARMVGIYEEIIRLGRNYGIGVSMISQRPQSVNKEVLNQTECLLVGQVNGSQERAALKKWITHQGMDVHLVDELPGLAIGTFYIWSPQWLQMLKKIQIGKKRTLDASSTPKVGESRQRRELKPLDLDDLKEKMVATIERAKADDPRELKKKIAQLEREKKAAETARASSAAKREPVRIPMLKDSQIQRLEQLAKKFEGMLPKVGGELANAEKRVDELKKLGDLIAGQTADISGAISRAKGAETHGLPSVGLRTAARTILPAPARSIAVRAPRAERLNGEHANGEHRAPEDGITARQQRMLDAAATLKTLGVEVSRETVCGWLGIHPRGGSVGEELKALSEAGMIVVDYGLIEVTDAGMAAAQQLDPAEAINRAKGGLSPRQARIFDIVVSVYPETITRDAIAEQMGIHPRGGSFGEDIGRLAGRGLVESSRGVIRARDFLFAAR